MKHGIRLVVTVLGISALLIGCTGETGAIRYSSSQFGGVQAIRSVGVECNIDDCRQYPEVHGFTRQTSRPNYLVEMIEETSRQLVSTPVQIYEVMFSGKVVTTF